MRIVDLNAAGAPLIEQVGALLIEGFADTGTAAWRTPAEAFEAVQYPDPLRAAADVASTAQHPLEFCRKVGFVVVGVLRDANGFGKPDIFMAKRVARLV